ncbi:MAG: DUF86 domain-containing protein [Candidatus Aminicenantes bacterium]|nr:DUF86 domain-containing protein [Candidatus Aminicenantes bacterium]
MTSGKVNDRVIVQRVRWIKQMREAIRDLPIKDRKEFLENPHNVAAAESYLRRALEALFDIGRHVLARKFAYPAAEYKEIANGLLEKRILTRKDAELLRQMAGYRNRMVHFYHEISAEELFEICAHHLDEIQLLCNRLVSRLRKPRAAKA